MTVAAVYQLYQVMPNLQQHMLRVAGVAELIGRQLLALSPPPPGFSAAELDRVILACLLHDLGNLAKFRLDRFPEFLQPQGLTYWQQQQAQFWLRYGRNAHSATLQMLTELKVEPRVVELVNAVSFIKAKANLEDDDYGRKLCAYADMRVAPHGVVSLADRLEDGRRRYAPQLARDSFSQQMANHLYRLEEQLFARLSISPADISAAAVAELAAGYLQRSV